MHEYELFYLGNGRADYTTGIANVDVDIVSVKKILQKENSGYFIINIIFIYELLF